ncbi:TIGR03749 family integrating conjugative element protein [Aromatoleum anaerobium]|uniref:TIGR03749 family integrating conjugative element protein n=1 Tax=Aromatoleum anaerobium TaxID=182180 RepID=UPI0002DE029D|nr:TIGR03749 family integrating conjugative element protein [Aromatoleum anaerobium]MCK0508630.1 TIGR03749 family integrating conjugative element protein [Aromatoleum anaerobium]
MKPAPRARKASSHDNGGTQHALFERLPVHVLLAPDAERLVHFPFVALMDLPPGLEGLLEVQIIEDTAYLTANAPFPRARVHVQAIDGTAKIPLDIEAAEGVAVAPMLQVHLPSGDDADDVASTGSREAPTVDMIELTRYAAKTLYAPSRLVPVLPGVQQEPVDRKTVPGLYRGAEVETAPLGAWSSGSLHVTAVRFTNRSDRPLELDIEQLRGRWIAATPQHWRLLPRGSEADTTAVYLISDRPFAAVPLWR